jgi:general secretion pathway protein G
MSSVPQRPLRRALPEAVKELLFTAAALVVLAVLLLPVFHFHFEGLYNQDRANLDLRNIEQALQLQVHRQGRLPTQEEGLDALVKSGALEALPMDPWRRPYRYSLLGDDEVELSSLGADGTPGGDGTDADLVRRFTPELLSR